MNEAETREIRAAVCKALEYVHSHGLVHTAVDAGHVLAVGNRIKLSSDTLREEAGSHTPAEDFRQLDAFLPAPAAEPPERAPARISAVRRQAFPIGVYALAGAVLGLIGYVFLPKSAPPARPVSVQPQGAPAAASPKVAIASPHAAAAQEYWRVIAFTYSHQDAAARRAQQINHKWAGAKAEVFTPNAGRPPYVVALGGRMSRDEAVRLLKSARGKGLPRDTYIQNYSR